MGFLAITFAIVSGVIAWLGFSRAVSDIQLIIGLIGASSAAILFVLAGMSLSIDSIPGRLRRIEKTVKKAGKPNNSDSSKNTMPDAIEEYRKSLPGEVSTADAIRQLATERLKEIGYLSS